MKTIARNIGALSLLFLAICSGAQSSPDFTGHWQQQTNSATPRQLEIEQNGKSLLVRTIFASSQGTRRLEVKYEIGGPPATYTGLDGDEFRSSVRWDGVSLLFEILEHEGENEITQKAVWTLSPDGKTLQVDRDVTKSGSTTHSVATFVRQS